MENWIRMNSADTDAKISKVNPKIVNYSNKLTVLATEYKQDKDPATLRKIRALRVKRNKLPSRIRTGIRVKYVRYADD